MDFTSNLTVLKEILDSGSIIWSAQDQAKVKGEEAVRVNHGIWNTAIAKFKQIPLWEGPIPNYNGEIDQPKPNLVFFPASDPAPRGTVIVSHGGAFVMRAGHEGFHTARRFLEFGFNVAVLTYRLVPYTRIDALKDIQRAVRILRANKEQLHITDKIAVLGYSAGGMLSANCATHYDRGIPNAVDPVEAESCRPDAAVICYGAFAGSSFPGKIFESPFDPEKRDERVYFAAEKNITTDTPPFFIWQTISDDPRHGITLAKELSDYGVPFELHCFPDGRHGVGLADGNNDSGERFPHLEHWSELAGEWLIMQGL